MRRSFRTLRLCAIPGVSPRAGMRCPVGALQTPHLPRAFPRSPHKYARGASRAPGPRVRRQRNLTRTQTRTKKPTRESPKSGPNTKSAPSGSGTGPERALEANTKNPSRTARKPLLPRASSASAGSIPRSPHPAPGPRRQPRHSATAEPLTPGGSGTGPERALEAIKPSPRAQRESLTLPRASLRAQARSRGAPSRH
jgi:hypothetical protein